MGQYHKVLQVVGYQNSGKTTLMEQLIIQAEKDGYRVAAIKHHGHGGMPNNDQSKDSARHEKAGAIITAVEGDGMLRMSIHQQEWSLATILAIYENFDIDLVLVEGYKKEKFPKIVILQLEEDFSLLKSLENIICVLYWPTYTGPACTQFPAFSIDDSQQYMAFLRKEMGQNHAAQ
ncbi:molybdopterin-guanine dinucleotide biosynthesis protein B [Kurthia sibirica]|uniref:Molybdopterin-guanine dinucleotide biosynthesis protein B n=1 Tax=Kurthia sibirica TaxID=202750 RepID=A0A2U3AKP3_9BACL|nr:molybdopterin-guanine dinucleotide biosynthesis protein B [Kurthia sibirica]PWI25116.1 molybdopterin-guanine dinucleotide biosynthesis protein B [Kurthia sibirica]GEK34037.1 molybdopterin-guanine dinucleotide biosynthesis protein MobB [Kurthia sibirica]